MKLKVLKKDFFSTRSFKYNLELENNYLRKESGQDVYIITLDCANMKFALWILMAWVGVGEEKKARFMN